MVYLSSVVVVHVLWGTRPLCPPGWGAGVWWSRHHGPSFRMGRQRSPHFRRSLISPVNNRSKSWSRLPWEIHVNDALAARDNTMTLTPHTCDIGLTLCTWQYHDTHPTHVRYWLNPYNAEIFLYKPWTPKVFFNL